MSAKDTLQNLLDEWANGTLTEADFRALQTALRESPEARARYLSFAHLDAALRDLATADYSAAAWEASSATIVRHSPRRRVVPLAALAAGLTLMLVGLGWIVVNSLTAHPPEVMGEGYAILTRSIDADWAPDDPVPLPGDVLAGRTLRLRSGIAQIEFFCGATVVFEGPGALEIRSATEAFCESGKLRASVPPAARGFIVGTPDGRIVDLGTEFGVEIGGDGAASVHVFDGKVEWHPGATDAVEELLGGEAWRGGLRMDAEGSGFLSAADLEGQASAAEDVRYARWMAHSRNLREDARLLAYFPMDQPGNWERRLVNAAPTGPEIDGAIVGARRASGRWSLPEKSALQFTPTGSRVRLVIPGEHSSLTFACWARIDSLDRQYNALFLTDNYQVGEPHWQIHEDGRILFSIKVREEGKQRNLMSWSPPVWDISRSGRWMHLAAVFDEGAQEIRHYVNGVRVFTDPVPRDFEIHQTRFGPGEIGNWGLPTRPEDARFAIRNLNGAIDEFAIFSAALSDAEISEMFHAGNPQ